MGDALLFDPVSRVLLFRMGESLTPITVGRMMAAVRAFAARHGPCPGILDLSAVVDVDLPSDFVKALANRPAALAGQRRVLVAPTDLLFGICRMFGAHQDATGDSPQIVRSLPDAYRLLGIDDVDFRRVGIEG
jgi:hypothetical protein